LKELQDEFPDLATTIAFKNIFYHCVFTSKIVVVYNQLPGVQSLLNLAVLTPNPTSFMEVSLEFGARDSLAQDGFR